ncbi:ATP-binding protein [Candidatus Woesearchaeota archaeon]|nr:ATP-binding protein [Candidatus Woesearchaeota archaeon]
METSDQLEKFRDFFGSYKGRIHETIAKGGNSVLFDFNELLTHDPELADLLLEDPENLLKAAEISLDNLDLPSNSLKIRFNNLPAASMLRIRDIRSIHIDRFIAVEGLVRQTSDVRPQVTSAKFECPSCGNTMLLLQIDTQFREPSRCSCGRRGKFRLISKDLIDAQRVVLEEAPENLDGGEQPKRLAVFLKGDLVDPKMEKRTTPGTKVRITGVVKEITIPLRTGGQSTRYDLIMESNYVEPIEETFEEINITKKEEEEILEASQDPKIYQRIVSSIAPSIYGHEDIKAALMLQLMGGVQKVHDDGTKRRGDMHVLLIGDPGCIAGDSQVALIYKGMEKIQDLGKEHLQPIKEFVTKIRKDGKDKYYDVAKVFQHYPKQPVLKVITETGKEVVCTYNQPFLTKEGWKRADEIKTDEKIRVMPKIPSLVKKLADTNFKEVNKASGKLKEVNLPKKVTPELASLYGYLIGDGNIHPAGYRVTCYINDEETDLIGKLSSLWKENFNIGPALITKEKEEEKIIDDGNGLLRKFISRQRMHLLEINSRQVAFNLSFLADKAVPQEIFRSPPYVVAPFISWLFEADGCAFGNGRGRTSIQLKSSMPKLLKDVQLLLLYFGIQSRIIEDNLCIRRSHDMELFAKHIGFVSEKKKNALQRVLQNIKEKNNSQKRKGFQRWEKISGIIPFGMMDVYDFEVPKSHTFIANGIVCHNSGKSQMLQFISKIAPKARLVSGKGASAAGLTATVVKDEFMRGWALEAGAFVLANGGFAIIDEMDKIDPDDISALHQALEQQVITIAKANIQATLKAKTTLLAAANPKLGRFDPYIPIPSQINMPSTLINRFDLIFPIRDMPSKELDNRIATHVLNLQQRPDDIKTEFSPEFLKKYISYARQKVNPVLTKEAVEEIKTFYVGLRNLPALNEQELKPIPISARQLEALVRLSEGSARVRLSKEVTKKDAQRAIETLKRCLMQVGFDPESGQIDIDRISTGLTTSKRSKIVKIQALINELTKKIGKKIPIDDLIMEASEQGIDEAQVNEALDVLKRDGTIFQPQPNIIERI